jgi:hypothetical protein
MRGLRARAASTAKTVVLPCALALVAATNGGAQTPPDIHDLLARVGERVADFYARAKNVICIETSTVQAIDLANSPVGFARTVESELRVEAGTQASDEAVVVRSIRKVNGRAPRESDKRERAGCTDPNPLSSEPLTFLLPAHRSEYQFKLSGKTTERDRPALTIDFVSVTRRSSPELVEDPGGHDDCFDWTGDIPSRGRVWVDAGSYDVLRVERGLRGPVEVKVPFPIQRSHHLDNWVVIVRDDVTIRYKTVAFTDPAETLLLPESINSFTVVRGGLQSTRRNQTFAGYRRFVTGGRVVP